MQLCLQTRLQTQSHDLCKWVVAARVCSYRSTHCPMNIYSAVVDRECGNARWACTGVQIHCSTSPVAVLCHRYCSNDRCSWDCNRHRLLYSEIQPDQRFPNVGAEPTQVQVSCPVLPTSLHAHLCSNLSKQSVIVFGCCVPSFHARKV